MDTTSGNDQPRAVLALVPASTDDAARTGGGNVDDSSGSGSDKRFGLPTAKAVLVRALAG